MRGSGLTALVAEARAMTKRFAKIEDLSGGVLTSKSSCPALTNVSHHFKPISNRRIFDSMRETLRRFIRLGVVMSAPLFSRTSHNMERGRGCKSRKYEVDGIKCGMDVMKNSTRAIVAFGAWIACFRTLGSIGNDVRGVPARWAGPLGVIAREISGEHWTQLGRHWFSLLFSIIWLCYMFRLF